MLKMCFSSIQDFIYYYRTTVPTVFFVLLSVQKNNSKNRKYLPETRYNIWDINTCTCKNSYF